MIPCRNARCPNVSKAHVSPKAARRCLDAYHPMPSPGDVRTVPELRRDLLEASSVDTPPSRLAALAMSNARHVRLAALGNPVTPRMTLHDAASRYSDHPAALLKIATNPSTPPETLDALLWESRSARLALAALSNPNMSQATLKRAGLGVLMGYLPSVAVRSTPPQLSTVGATIALNPSTPPETVSRVFGVLDVARKTLASTKLSIEVMETALERQPQLTKWEDLVSSARLHAVRNRFPKVQSVAAAEAILAMDWRRLDADGPEVASLICLFG